MNETVKLETTVEERSELVGQLRTGLMAVAAFVRGNDDARVRMDAALKAIDTVEVVLEDFDRLLTLVEVKSILLEALRPFARYGVEFAPRREEIEKALRELEELAEKLAEAPRRSET